MKLKNKKAGIANVSGWTVTAAVLPVLHTLLFVFIQHADAA